MAKQTGSCKWWNDQKGYGFITPDDGSSDVFVHQTALHSNSFRSLAEGKYYVPMKICYLENYQKRANIYCSYFLNFPFMGERVIHMIF